MADILLVLDTGTGFWNPVAWILGAAVAGAIALLLYALGERGYKEGTPQEEPFLSGNPEPGGGLLHVRAGNLYWGFLDAMGGYYERLVSLHTGDLHDYVLWYMGISALFLVAVVVFR
ncbi:MAG: hydrogenase [Methanolinea sp.]|nr:hydrogenase [Methanolinea sp.]